MVRFRNLKIITFLAGGMLLASQKSAAGGVEVGGAGGAEGAGGVGVLVCVIEVLQPASRVAATNRAGARVFGSFDSFNMNRNPPGNGCLRVYMVPVLLN